MKEALFVFIALLILSLFAYYKYQRSMYVESEIEKVSSLSIEEIESIEIKFERFNNEVFNKTYTLTKQEEATFLNYLHGGTDFDNPEEFIPINFFKDISDCFINLKGEEKRILLVVGRLESHKQYDPKNWDNVGFIEVQKEIENAELYLREYYNNELATYIFEELVLKTQ